MLYNVSELNQTQYKHNGKARRGDGNDITPSPSKLYALGNELKKLNRIINDLTPVSELPAGARTKSRKEKNKLASRYVFPTSTELKICSLYILRDSLEGDQSLISWWKEKSIAPFCYITLMYSVDEKVSFQVKLDVGDIYLILQPRSIDPLHIVAHFKQN